MLSSGWNCSAHLVQPLLTAGSSLPSPAQTSRFTQTSVLASKSLTPLLASGWDGYALTQPGKGWKVAASRSLRQHHPLSPCNKQFDCRTAQMEPSSGSWRTASCSFGVLGHLIPLFLHGTCLPCQPHQELMPCLPLTPGSLPKGANYALHNSRHAASAVLSPMVPMSVGLGSTGPCRIAIC